MTFVPVSKETACVDVEDVIAVVRSNTCLVSVMLANNETGVIMVRGLKTCQHGLCSAKKFLCSLDKN